MYNPHVDSSLSCLNLFYNIVLLSPQEKKVRFEGEVKEMSDDEVRSIKWDGAELKVIFNFFIIFIFRGIGHAFKIYIFWFHFSRILDLKMKALKKVCL